MDNHNATILIVDDERVNRLLIRSILEKKYSSIIEACDGEEALAMLKNNDVSLMLLDLMMPKLDGYGVLNIMRKHPKYQTIPVVVVTALTNVKDNAKAIELGADGFITKPISGIILEVTVENLLKQSYMQRKLLEAEKTEMFLATVVTANHEINQPLTSLLCSMNLISNLYKDDRITNPEKFDSYMKKIVNAAKEISNILIKLRSIKDPLVKSYVDDVKMIDIENAPVPKPTDIFPKSTFIKDSELQGKNIYIVDEEDLITGLLTDFLSDKGFTVTAFNNYENALSSFKVMPDPIDIVIIDINEPDKEGLKLFYDMSAINSETKYILSSAFDIKDDVISAVNHGASAFIPKPYDAEHLFFYINKVFR